MSIHRYTSRGRTRQPKNVAMQKHDGTVKQPLTYPHFRDSGSVTVIANANLLDNDLTSSIAGRNGYSTENQQYLNFCVRTTGAIASAIDVYGYIRQFGVWGQLKTQARTDKSFFHSCSVNVQVSGSPNTTHYVSVPIYGVDRVGFVCSDTHDTILYVAGSTF